MFEFHGWIRVESTSGRTEWSRDGLQYPDDEELFSNLERYIESLEPGIRECVSLKKTANGITSLAISGLFNHFNESVFDLYLWVAENGNRSLGALFIRDDEDDIEDYDPYRQYRVIRLSDGELSELESRFDMSNS